MHVKYSLTLYRFISDDDYAHGKRVWEVFGCATSGDYHNL